MNVPAIAKKTFEDLRNQPEFMAIVHSVLDHLKNLTTSFQRAQYTHNQVDFHNSEVFSHPLVQKMSPCKMGCSGCCHTQVSVTDDEAELLAKRIEEGVLIKHDLLTLQAAAENDSAAYYALSYQDRRCIFLDDHGACRVYEDRPSVCRTNAVIGSAEQCDTSISIQPTRLIRTPKSDMAIYASYLFSKASGTLPFMVNKLVKKKESSKVS